MILLTFVMSKFYLLSSYLLVEGEYNRKEFDKHNLLCSGLCISGIFILANCIRLYIF